MIYPNKSKADKDIKIKHNRSKPSLSHKVFKVTAKAQIAKIKSVLLQKGQTQEFHSKKTGKSQINLKGLNSQVSELFKDFNHNFSILDADKSQMLNYSRFSILLQSLHFIKSPQERILEERSLILKAWKLARNSEDKYIWKNNAFTLCMCIMNLHNKNIQRHSQPLGLGKMVNGIYCVNKDEVRSLHKLFFIFYENRKNIFSSVSLENRATLKRNLSFEQKKTKLEHDSSLSPCILKLSHSLELTDHQIQSSVLNLDSDSRVNDTLMMDGENSKIVGIREQDSLNESLNESTLKGRLRIRLTTQVLQKNTVKPERTTNCLYRSMTLKLNNSESFVAHDFRGRDGEDVDLYKSKRNFTTGHKVLVNFKEDDDGKVILQALLPKGVHEIVMFRKDELNEGLVEELVSKFDLAGENAAEFRRQVYLKIEKWGN